jgi:hypothetical protein
VTKLKFVSAALIAAAIIATPAIARESHVGRPHLTVNANASTAPEALYPGERDRFREDEGHDVWDHWGTYYGPMVPSIR